MDGSFVPLPAARPNKEVGKSSMDAVNAVLDVGCHIRTKGKLIVIAQPRPGAGTIASATKVAMHCDRNAKHVEWRKWNAAARSTRVLIAPPVNPIWNAPTRVSGKGQDRPVMTQHLFVPAAMANTATKQVNLRPAS